MYIRGVRACAGVRALRCVPSVCTCGRSAGEQKDIQAYKPIARRWRVSAGCHDHPCVYAVLLYSMDHKTAIRDRGQDPPTSRDEFFFLLRCP